MSPYEGAQCLYGGCVQCLCGGCAQCLCGGCGHTWCHESDCVTLCAAEEIRTMGYMRLKKWLVAQGCVISWSMPSNNSCLLTSSDRLLTPSYRRLTLSSCLLPSNPCRLALSSCLLPSNPCRLALSSFVLPSNPCRLTLSSCLLPSNSW